MHEDIVEHVAHDKGYNKGLEDGKEIAWNLLGDLVDWYRKQMDIPDKSPGYRSRVAVRRGRYEAALYAQMVVKKGQL